MLRRLGYACLSLSVPDSSPRGTILRNATPDRLRELIGINLERLVRVLRFNVVQGIRLFRISSDLIPFGSHPINHLRWWEEFQAQLGVVGGYIREHDLRVSLHPGQHTVLSAIDPKVAEAARRDLEYHGRLLDALGLDTTHKIILHVGGAYGDKQAALFRWAARADRLPPSLGHRLVVENDERLFGAEEILALSEQTGVPVLFDVFHHRVYSGQDRDLPRLLRAAFATWRPERDGVPKVHFSSQAAGQRPGAHADFVDPAEFRQFLAMAPEEIVFDCMLEAKAKDRALFRLREALSLAA